MNQTTIEFSEMLGRRVRLGSWEDQKISTYRKIIEAINEENWDHAADLADYFTDEANELLGQDNLPDNNSEKTLAPTMVTGLN